MRHAYHDTHPLSVDHMSQVFLSSDVDHDLEHQPESIEIRPHLPLLYWSGTVVIARLGTQTAGVFVTIYDIGRGVKIEARDVEDGPMLASSTVPLEIWTGEYSKRFRNGMGWSS